MPKASLPAGAKYAFHGSKQREALTSGGMVAMGVRLYQPQLGRFMQVDPVLGGTESPYGYPSDPVNGADLDGRISTGWIQYLKYLPKALKAIRSHGRRTPKWKPLSGRSFNIDHRGISGNTRRYYKTRREVARRADHAATTVDAHGKTSTVYRIGENFWTFTRSKTGIRTIYHRSPKGNMYKHRFD